MNMPYDNLSIAEFKEGDERVFKAIYETDFKALCYYAEKMVKQVQEAEDIVVETFAKLWARHAHFDSLEMIKPWLYLTTKNACLNFHRNDTRKKQAQQQISHTLVLTDKENASFFSITSDGFQKITDAIEGLPVKCGKVFKCYFVEGLNTHEIAQRLSISEKTVLN